MSTLPAGITSREHMPYGYRRWNGAVWSDAETDAYNRQLDYILERHDAGMHAGTTQREIDNLYRMATVSDYLN